MIGTFIALLVSLIIFPAFATIDIENRIRYALLNVGKMHTIIVQSFLQKDQVNAQALLTRASTIEQMIREAIRPIPVKFNYARLEPSKILQRMFNFKRRNVPRLTLEGLFSTMKKKDVAYKYLLFFRTRSIDHLIVSSYSFNAINGERMSFQRVSC